jgi:hypothetical protein
MTTSAVTAKRVEEGRKAEVEEEREEGGVPVRMRIMVGDRCWWWV